jgi:hypothetical protein
MLRLRNQRICRVNQFSNAAYFCEMPKSLFATFPSSDTFSQHFSGEIAAIGYCIRAAANVTRREYRMKRLVSIVEKKTVVRARDLYRSGIHPGTLSRALQHGLVLKIGRGLYARKDFSADFARQIVLACKRVPHGIVCLHSAFTAITGRFPVVRNTSR